MIRLEMVSYLDLVVIIHSAIWLNFARLAPAMWEVGLLSLVKFAHPAIPISMYPPTNTLWYFSDWNGLASYAVFIPNHWDHNKTRQDTYFGQIHGFWLANTILDDNSKLDKQGSPLSIALTDPISSNNPSYLVGHFLKNLWWFSPANATVGR